MDRAHHVGVVGFLVIGVGRDMTPVRQAVALAKQYPNRVAASVGVHPHDALLLNDDTAAEIEALAREECVVAVGEMGLDYHYDRAPRPQQKETFVRQIALARAVGKPIIVHTREAAEDTLALLESENAKDVGGIIHCFSEDRAFAKRALDLGFDLSFSGIVTFKTAQSIHDVAAWAPDDRILVETDSPYLAPVPMRGKPCEPAYVTHTAHRVAALRGQPFDVVAAQTTRNAERRLGRRFLAEGPPA